MNTTHTMTATHTATAMSATRRMGAVGAVGITAPSAAASSAARSAARADALAESLAQAAPHAGALSDLNCATLSPTGCLDAILAWERLARHAHAGLMHALAALAHTTADDKDLAESEVCAALAWSPIAAQNRLYEADTLTRTFPTTLHHLSEGSVSIEQARCLVQLTGGLNDPAAHTVETHVLPRMPGQSVAATRQAVRRAVLRTDPDAAAKRHHHERQRRRVETWPENDGMATLSFYLPADIAQMAMRTLTALAHKAKRTNKNSTDKRTLDQRRADLLPALLHHAATGGTFTPTATPTIPARINVVVGIETLLSLSHEPGHLHGYGPICPEQTRRIAHAHAARWQFLLTATDGTVVDTSPRTYTPTAAIKRLTKLKFTTCTFPHCRMPADRCDLDHATPFANGGPTTPDNLAPLCRRHHNHKTHGHWQLDRHDNDTNTWTSTQTGRTYTTAPTRYPLAT